MKEKPKVVTVAFAGVKFKARAMSGREYIKIVETCVINKLLQMFPNAEQHVICEEKYAFTPDNFKAATEAKRVKDSMKSIAHLKTADEMLS